MKYYLLKVTNQENEQVDCVAYTTKKEIDSHIRNMRWHRCPKHNIGIPDATCDCRRYSTYLINEKLVDKKETVNV